jgi:omega-6 fatty acid desaturase (delta-12 desaturase)
MHETQLNTMFGRREYSALKERLNFERSLPVTLAMLGLDGVVLGAGIKLLKTPGAAAFVASQILFAVFFFHGFCLVHESGHGNCSSSRLANVVIGHLASVMCLMPFYPWKYIHQKHHVWAGNPERDPTGKNLKTWRREKKVPWLLRASWRTWVPLGALAQHVVFWTYPLVLWREDRSKILQCAGSVLLLPASYVTLYLCWPEIFHPSNFALACVIYLFVEELVNLPHHADLFVFSERLQLWDQWKAARSCYYPPLVSEALFLNFNFHVEHHLFPSLPWYRLRGARSLVREAVGDGYQEALGISWNVDNRSRDVQDLFLRSDVGN